MDLVQEPTQVTEAAPAPVAPETVTVQATEAATPAPEALAETGIDPNGVELVEVTLTSGRTIRVDPLSAISLVRRGKATLVDRAPVDPNRVATTTPVRLGDVV